MASPDLHIVSFAVPYPPVYGGAIDVYNRVKALHDEGVKIHLHSFVYRSFNPHNALNEITHAVHYYPRISWPALLAPGTPYIVASRMNPKLLDRLNENDAPVLFEGVHTSGFADDLQNRKKFLRAHNIEHQYYGHLAKDSQRFQYLFFQRESLALERFECKHAGSFDKVFTISPKDQVWYEKQHAACEFLPVFHGQHEMDVRPGRGEYLLYQGDLSIESNQKAVIELLNAPGLDKYPVVIAGKSGGPSFEEKLTKYPNLKRDVDVAEDKMRELIRNAQIVLVRSRHPSGMKVKIFTALYHGRFIVSDENSITNTALDNALHVYHDINELGPLLEKLWPMEMNDQLLKERKETLQTIPDDREKARAIIRHLD